MAHALRRIDKPDCRIIHWAAAHSTDLLRIALGVIFLWFGVLKLFPGLSPAELLATQTMSKITLGHVPASISLPLLGILESIIGVGLIIRRHLRVVLALMAVQMSGTLLPLLLFPQQTWQVFPIVPTFAGQYILKNLVLVSGGLVIGTTLRDPDAAPPPKDPREQQNPTAPAGQTG